MEFFYFGYVDHLSKDAVCSDGLRSKLQCETQWDYQIKTSQVTHYNIPRIYIFVDRLFDDTVSGDIFQSKL